jgi:hypothetical protein
MTDPAASRARVVPSQRTFYEWSPLLSGIATGVACVILFGPPWSFLGVACILAGSGITSYRYQSRTALSCRDRILVALFMTAMVGAGAVGVAVLSVLFVPMWGWFRTWL